MDFLSLLATKTGHYHGDGINHEGSAFHGKFLLTTRFGGKGLTIDFSATGKDGTVYHEEHSLLSLNSAGKPALWILSNNHPAILEHHLMASPAASGAAHSFSFATGSANDINSFREIVTIDLWPDDSITYRYAWGMPGQPFADRSGVRMKKAL